MVVVVFVSMLSSTLLVRFGHRGRLWRLVFVVAWT